MKKDHTPEYMKQLSGKILEINFKTQSLKMSFLATEDICHSNGTIIQGGFTTVMMDSCMAFLVMELTNFIYTPMSIDINVSFLAAGNPGALECQSKIVKLGKSIGFASPIFGKELPTPMAIHLSSNNFFRSIKVYSLLV